MKTFPRQVRHVVAGLRRRFRRAGFGVMARVTEELGLRRSYFSEKSSRPPRIFDVGVLLAALESLGADVAVFFRELYPAAGGGELWEGPEPVEERATPAIRRAVRLAGERMRGELGLDVAVGDVEGDGASGGGSAGTSADRGPTVGAEWLEGLDARRQVEPKSVIGELAPGIQQVRAALLPRALGTWGSALWVLGEAESAAYLNRRALRLARGAGDDGAVADLLLRRAHIVADFGDYHRALALADLASGTSSRIGDRAGRGKAAADQAKWLYYLRRPRQAIAAAERALELLPESLPASRAAACSGICLCCLELGELERAQELAEEAERLPVGPWERGKLSWIRASICRKLGNRSEAMEHLRRAVEIFSELHHGETLLVFVELVQVLLEEGRSSEARQVCRATFPLAEPLEGNPILSAAHAELMRLALTGRSEGPTLDLVLRIRAVVERERNRQGAEARRAWRALAVG